MSNDLHVDDIQALASKINVHVPDGLQAGYLEMLKSGVDAMQKVIDMDGMLFSVVRWTRIVLIFCIDFIPVPDTTLFPRRDIVRPTRDENPYNAWAVKVTVESTHEELRKSGPLGGKRVILKVSMITIPL